MTGYQTCLPIGGPARLDEELELLDLPEETMEGGEGETCDRQMWEGKFHENCQVMAGCRVRSRSMWRQSAVLSSNHAGNTNQPPGSSQLLPGYRGWQFAICFWPNLVSEEPQKTDAKCQSVYEEGKYDIRRRFLYKDARCIFDAGKCRMHDVK